VREVRLVNRTGARIGGFDASVIQKITKGRSTSLARADLADAILQPIADRVELLFGTTLTSLTQDGDGVDVVLSNGMARRFELVVGADGIHSRLRSLAWRPNEVRLHPMGYAVAAFHAPGYLPRDLDTYVTYVKPGRSLSRFALRGDATLGFMVVAESKLGGAQLADRASQKAALHRVFSSNGWETARLLAAMDAADDFYFDRVAQVELADWSRGRLVLLGDAVACPSLLSGEGSGLAMAEAYVLAGELACAGDDVVAGLKAYERRMQPFLLAKQKSARKFAKSFTPSTGFGVWVQRTAMRMMRIPKLAEWMLGMSLRDDFQLPDYEA
jgi:2-polyprenyl-6-methoxyphenol hydroxylase-like FAD-dependent oxidoreductase